MSSHWYCSICDTRVSDGYDECPHCHGPEYQEEIESLNERLSAMIERSAINGRIAMNLQVERDDYRMALEKVLEFWRNIDTPKPYFIGDTCEDVLAKYPRGEK